jgi:hypothetical protein
MAEGRKGERGLGGATPNENLISKSDGTGAAQHTPDLAGLNAEQQTSAGRPPARSRRKPRLPSETWQVGSVGVYGAALTHARSVVSLAARLVSTPHVETKFLLH